MSFDLSSIQRSRNNRKPRVIVYGDSGLGKTTFGASAPNPIFILTEDGLGSVEAPYFPLAQTFEDVMSAFVAIYDGEHDFETLVIDSLDWLEPLIWAEVCRTNNVEHIEKLPYGKGYIEAASLWRRVFDAVTAIRDKRGMWVIMLAHSQVVRIEDPTQAAYDCHGLKLHKRAAAIAEEFADIIGFVALKTFTVDEKSGFNGNRVRARTTGERQLHLTPSPSYVAKNRFNLPERTPLSWDAFQQSYTAAMATNLNP